MIKGILIDIDNTLYNYSEAHNIATNDVEKEIANKVDLNEFREKFVIARDLVHKNLNGTASSHNRLLYFQKVLELMQNKDVLLPKILYEIYWNSFINNMNLYENVLAFFKKNQSKKICLVTDLTADIQYKKIEKMNIAKYIDAIVTSEEVGAEKPNKKMFKLALKKINLNPNEVCMIGDSYEKDIVGANNLGIKSYWLSDTNKKQNLNTIQFKNFKELMELLDNE